MSDHKNIQFNDEKEERVVDEPRAHGDLLNTDLTKGLARLTGFMDHLQSC